MEHRPNTQSRKASPLLTMQHSVYAAVRSSPFDLTSSKRHGRSIEVIDILNTSFEFRFKRHCCSFDYVNLCVLSFSWLDYAIGPRLNEFLFH